VIRKVPSAINDVVEETLETTQKLLRKDPSALNKDDIQAAAIRAKESRSTSARGGAVSTYFKSTTATDMDLSPPDSPPKKITAVAKGKSTKAPVTKVNRKAAKQQDDDDDDDDDVEDKHFDECNEETKGPQKRGRAATSKALKSSGPAPKKSRQSSTATTSSRPSRVSARSKKTPVYVDPEDVEVISLASGDESDALDDIKGISEDEIEELFDSSDEDDNKRKNKSIRNKKQSTVSKTKTATNKGGKVTSSDAKNRGTGTAVNGKGKNRAPAIYEEISDGSIDETPTPAPKASAASKRLPTSNAKQQKLSFSQTAGSTTSSSRSVRKRNTSSAMDDW
jgi:hypothetical protein